MTKIKLLYLAIASVLLGLTLLSPVNAGPKAPSSTLKTTQSVRPPVLVRPPAIAGKKLPALGQGLTQSAKPVPPIRRDFKKVAEPPVRKVPPTTTPTKPPTPTPKPPWRPVFKPPGF